MPRSIAGALPLTVIQTVNVAALAAARNAQSCGFIA
jgi:hypothetical protein